MSKTSKIDEINIDSMLEEALTPVNLCPETPKEIKKAIYQLILEIVGEDIENKHEEVDEGCIVCNTCDHIVDPTDTEFSKDCYCDTTNALKAVQRQKLNHLFGKE